MLNVKFKKLRPDARIPTKGTEDAAGLDLYAAEQIYLCPDVPVRIPTGLAFEIPKGYCGVVYSRSSSFIKSIICTPLIVDSDYRGEVFVSALYSGVIHGICTTASNMVVHALKGKQPLYHVQKGDRIAQIRFEKVEDVQFEEVEELSETKRGEGGYGSTGR